jgi:hypothetical protein
MVQRDNSDYNIEAASLIEAPKVSTIPELGLIGENYLPNQDKDLPELSAICASHRAKLIDSIWIAIILPYPQIFPQDHALRLLQKQFRAASL